MKSERDWVRMKIAKIPESFKGTPILFVAASLLSLAF